MNPINPYFVYRDILRGFFFLLKIFLVIYIFLSWIAAGLILMEFILGVNEWVILYEMYESGTIRYFIPGFFWILYWFGFRSLEDATKIILNP